MEDRRIIRMRPVIVIRTLMLAAASALRVAVLSKIILDQVVDTGNACRLGGGGVQAAVGVQIAAEGTCRCRLIAPVGVDFDDRLLTDLHARGVDTSVDKLSHVRRTPGEIIRYEGEDMLWNDVGWDQWEELCDWEPPLNTSDFDVVHVLVEGGGAGELRSALAAMQHAEENGMPLPLLSVEPVMHAVDEGSLSSLCKLTARADVVSPDLLTAARIAHVAHDFARVHTYKRDAAAVGKADLLRDRASLDATVRACARALKLPSSAVLAVRDGARGSYLLHDDSFLHVPALAIGVPVDPTGAGNAYAGALCTHLASGATPADAAQVASAVGAAFCCTADFAPELSAAIEWCKDPSKARIIEH